MKKKMVVLCMIFAMTISFVFGCGKGTGAEKNTASVSAQKEEAEEFTENDLKDVISGIEDHYVLQNAENIDFLKEVKFDKEVVKSVKADDSKVDLKKEGTYQLTYTVVVYEDALQEHLKESAQTEKKEKAEKEETVPTEKEKKTSEEETEKTEEKTAVVKVSKKVTVVTKEKAQELADAGKTVWTDKNELAAKKEDTKKKTEEKKGANEGASEKKKEASSSDDAKKDTGSSSAGNGTSQNHSDSGSSNGNAGSSSAPAEQKPEQPGTSQPSQAPAEQKPEHTHTWVAQTTTVHHEATGHYENRVVQAAWDEPVYEYHTVCICGYDFTVNGTGELDYHVFELGHSYGTQSVQTGTIHHDAVTESVWVQDSAAWDETVTTGYVCSGCGATK